MVQTQNQSLKLSVVKDVVTIAVGYQAIFSPLERHLAALGLTYREVIDVFGIDPPGSFTGTLMGPITPFQNIPVTDGATPLIVNRSRTFIRTRAQMQEDPIGDDDEIRCRITVNLVGLPPAVPGWTPQQTLKG
jgi:hypothetical protein